MSSERVNLDELTVYVFVRNDLPPGQDDIQTNHACIRLGWQLGAKFGGPPANPYLITKEKLNTKSLLKLAGKCPQNEILHYLMLDTDVDPVNPTALAVFPLNDEQKEFFRKYPLRNYSPREEKAALNPVDSGAGFNAERGAAVVAQSPQEHSVSNGEVARPASSQRLHCFD